jgi:8-oxo-dGTP diphosphatase
MGEPAYDLTRAAGAVLWRHDGVGIEVAVIHRPKYNDWSFPKGKIKAGEHILRAAVREVEEETGVKPQLGRRLPARNYLIKGDRSKRVDYWLASGEAAPFTPSEEVDRLEWLPIRYAEQRLSYERDIDLLQEFAAGPRHTTAFIILRHGSAGDKREWQGDDVLRPLDERGQAEAEALVELLGVFGPVRLISSATTRCVATVLPYALATGTRMETEPAFTVGVNAVGMPSPADAKTVLLSLVSDRKPTVVCTHGEVVSDLIAGLCAKFGEKTPDTPHLRKGGFWVVHLADNEIAAMERHHAIAHH